METIKNDKLKVEVSEHGAELLSIKDNGGEEYLWQGDPAYWGRRSPILFPIVGTVCDNTYRVNGKAYHLTRHGFARDMDFRLLAKGDEQVVFGLHDTAETLERYPFHFNLAVSYKLTDNRIHVVWHVENTDDKTICFQIGGHPAFLVPGAKAGEPVQGAMRFDNAEPMRVFINKDGFLTKGYHPFATENGLFRFTEDSFKDDAIVFDHSQLRHVELLDAAGNPHVSLDFKTPAVGIWTPCGKHAPFVCIEPWYGITDAEGFDGEFRDKYLMNQLLPGSSFMSEYVITIG
jgi:galactose mutarotase-like enzyme